MLEFRFLAALLCALVLGGCAKHDDTASGDASPAAVATDSGASAASAASAAASPVADTSGASAVNASATPIASPTAIVAFTDIGGVNGETAIEQLAALGVFKETSGTFEPGKPIERGEFIRWLVLANNALWADTPAKQVHTADSTESSTFSDVAKSDPDFPYIQGMQDAGYSVGFPDRTFKPSQMLTREQMFAIKNVFDRGSVDPGLAKSVDFARNSAMPNWKDKAQISKTYIAAIATGDGGGNTSFSLVYGASALFHPQLAVTRAQAATLLTAMGDHTFYGGSSRTATQGLAAAASHAP